jgi:hypothetical protein
MDPGETGKAYLGEKTIEMMVGMNSGVPAKLINLIYATGSVLKEKLAVLGSVGILPNHQMQLQEARAQTGYGYFSLYLMSNLRFFIDL